MQPCSSGLLVTWVVISPSRYFSVCVFGTFAISVIIYLNLSKTSQSAFGRRSQVTGGWRTQVHEQRFLSPQNTSLLHNCSKHHRCRTPLSRLSQSLAYKLLILALEVRVPPAQRGSPLGYVLHRPLNPQLVEMRRRVVVRGYDVEFSKADMFQHVLHSLLRCPGDRGLLIKRVPCSQASVRPPGPAKEGKNYEVGRVKPNEQEEVRGHLRVLFAQLPGETLRETLEGRLRGVIRSVATEGSSKLVRIFL